MSPSFSDRDETFLQVMRLSAMLDSESIHESLSDVVLSRALYIAFDIDAKANERGEG